VSHRHDAVNKFCVKIVILQEWTQALSERFMFHLPVVVNWDYFDDRLLGRFWTSSPERAALRAHLPDEANRILVFVRGVGVAKDSGLFIDQKVGKVKAGRCSLRQLQQQVRPLAKAGTQLPIAHAPYV
jgi:hypothetical protein